MVSPFLEIVQKLHELGFFNFVLPWFIVAAVFYGLLRKSKILGEGIAVNGVVALTIAFFIWGYFIISSPTDLAIPLSRFFTQFSIILIGFLLAFLGASLAYPDLTSSLKDIVTGSAFFWVILVIAAVMIFLTSGLVNVLGLDVLGKSKAGVILIIFLLTFILLLVAVMTGGAKS